MFSKILCPVDFSVAANNAMEYAAKLAKILSAELKLIHIEHIPLVAAAPSLGEGIGWQAKNDSVMASKRLNEISTEIKNYYHITCSYEVDITINTLSGFLSSIQEKNAIIVMGTNGADQVSQYYFGTNAYHTIQKIQIPLIIVPEFYSFSTYKNIVYVYSYGELEQTSLLQFKDFINYFSSTEVTFLQINKNDTTIRPVELDTIEKDIIELFKGEINVSFKRIFSDDMASFIENYSDENSFDLLVMTKKHRTLIEAIFEKEPLKRLSAIATFPILVLHS